MSAVEGVAQAVTGAVEGQGMSHQAPSRSHQAQRTRSVSALVHLVDLEVTAMHLHMVLLAHPLRSEPSCLVLQGLRIKAH